MMAKSAGENSIGELAHIIKTKTDEVNAYLVANGIPAPSLGPNAPATTPLPPHIVQARETVMVATSELQALMAGPLGHITRLLSPQINILIGLQAMYRYQIPQVVGVDEELSFEEIAQRCSLERSEVSRLLRVCTANYVFLEKRKGYISHSAISLLLKQQPFAFQWMGYVCDELWPAEARTMDAIHKWPGSQEPDESGFALTEPSGRAFFDLLKYDAARAQRLADSMSFLQSSPQLNPNFLIKDLQWDVQAGPRKLVDVGGSVGSIDIALLRAYPRLMCVVQDLPEIVKAASVPDDLAGRLEFAAHDFFEEQPIRDADFYYLRSILHDWSDKYAAKILQALTPALKTGAKVIINEVCLPEPGVLPKIYEQLIRGYDLAMKAKFNSKERDIDDWKALLRMADARFHLERVTCSPGSVLSVIEVAWKG